MAMFFNLIVDIMLASCKYMAMVFDLMVDVMLIDSCKAMATFSLQRF